ncbi:DUF6538 domain-containing protein [Propionivibrio sp.]|uniref:DUF6538 domain-containing protein n=1 Tax=Propionivibrio sp. TaxID=2212460 RepID=UPI00272DD427|nr:DUF6538 domain-containing protein [Propionivibrio sp.]
MALHFSSHLHKNRYGIFGFRVVVPKDLRLSFPKKEIRISLRTSSPRKAKPLALRLQLVTSDYFSRMRRVPSIDEAIAIGHDLIRELSANTFEDLTEQLTEFLPAVEGKGAKLLQELISLRSRHSEIQEEKRSLLRELVPKLADISDDEVDSLFCDFYADVTPLMAQESQLVSQLNEFSLRAQRHLQDRLHSQELEVLREAQAAEIGSITDIAAEIAAKVARRAGAPLSDAGVGQPLAKVDSKPLAAIVEAYCDNQISEGSWTDKTEAENRAIFALWLRIVGDQSVADYGYEQHREYKSKLSKLPANLNKNPLYRDKAIDDILAMECKPAAPNTINKNLVRISALFEWATKYGYTSLNPARGMTMRNPKRASEERKAFSDADLRSLFNPPAQVKSRLKHPYQHWVPLIALFTGARLNEICQLHLCDFDESDGVHVIRISDEGGSKRLKTKAARRLIPIHSKLIDAGLLDYVSELRDKGHDRLFPELSEGRDGYGTVVSKWFARYCSQCGITDPGKVFHSFRHTVIDCLKQAGVSKEKIAALVGHEDDSVTFGRYGKEFSPGVMSPVVEMLKWGVTGLTEQH